MNLDEREEHLIKKFLGKTCRYRYGGGGIETIGVGKDKIVNIGSEAGVFKRVAKIKMQHGPPSGWYWGARLIYDDGTHSSTFTRMGDIEIQSGDLGA